MGDLIPIAALPDWLTRAPKRANSQMITKIKSALARIDPDPRENWLRVAMALHHASNGDDWGKELWDEWSARSAKFDQTDNNQTWKHFDSERDDGVTIATVYQMAKDAEDTWLVEQLITSGDALMARDIAPPVWLVEGFMLDNSWSQIAGWRGIGKTMLTVSLALALSRGEPFLFWNVAKPVHVLFIDGEMRAGAFKKILELFGGNTGCGQLDVMLSEDFYRIEERPFTLNNVLHQQQLKNLLAQLEALNRRPSVIIFDNLSAMTSGLDENSNSDQDSLIAFMMGLRHDGYSIIQIHHTGKGGDQRGASRREDMLDVSIKLSPPDEKDKEGRAKFVFEFTKTRGMLTPKPDRFVATLGTDEYGKAVWTTDVQAEKQKPKWLQILKFIVDKKPQVQSEIMAHFNLAAGTVSEHVSTLRKKNFLGDGLDAKPSAKKYIAKAYPEDGDELF